MRCFGIVFLLPLLLLLTNVDTQAAPQVKSPSQSNAAAMNGATQVASNAGVRTCLERIDQISNFITTDTQSKFLAFLPTRDANSQVTSFSYEVQLPSKETGYASMSTAPVSGGCNALYETVIFWEESCDVVTGKSFAGAKVMGVIQKNIKVLDGGPSLRIFMMPAGKGCVSIKKEVIF